MAYYGRRVSRFKRYYKRGHSTSMPYSRGSGLGSQRILGVLNGNAIKIHQSYHTGTTGDGRDSVRVSCLSQIPVVGVAGSATTNARDSTIVRPLDLVMNGSLAWTEASTCQYYRVVIFQWFEDDALTTPTVANVLETTNSSTTADYGNCLANTDDLHRCRILWDQLFTPPIMKEGSHTTHTIPFRVRVARLGRIRFAPASVNARGHIYMFSWGSNTAAQADTPIFRMDFRLRFIDY